MSKLFSKWRKFLKCSIVVRENCNPYCMDLYIDPCPIVYSLSVLVITHNLYISRHLSKIPILTLPIIITESEEYQQLVKLKFSPHISPIRENLRKYLNVAPLSVNKRRRLTLKESQQASLR